MALMLAPVALADWDEGGPHEMHYPQLPDPSGWDVAFNDYPLADDWLCAQAGPVEGIHFWYSWRSDAQPASINGIGVQIYSNNPCGPAGYSMPDQLLWQRTFGPGEFMTRYYGSGQQGWLNPVTGERVENDHFYIYQANIVGISDPFHPAEGEIYWLSLQVDATAECGWKTTLDRWNDDAVYWHDMNGYLGANANGFVAGDAGIGFVAMPESGYGVQGTMDSEGFDLAFVITPEPASALLMLAGLGLMARLRRR